MAKFIFQLFLVLGLTASYSSLAQTIRINEVVASNATFDDEDGDSPDWIELYNYGSTAISLEGMSLTDDLQDPDKWVFPQQILEPGQYLVVFASDKNRFIEGSYRTLIDQGDIFKYLIPEEEIGFEWLNINYDDSEWESGPSGFGYGDNDDVTILPFGTQSIYLRKEITIADPTLIESMFFNIDYDDGFRAFINGSFVCGANIEGISPAFNAPTIIDHEANIYQGGYPDRFDLPDPSSYLRAGKNLVSIQVHNISPNSSDLTAIPYLSAYYPEQTNEGSIPPQLVRLQGSYYHTNFKISSGGETIALFDNSGTLVDSLSTGPLLSDLSIGIPLSDPTIRKYFDPPTPGLPNTSSSYWGFIDSDIVFSKESGKTSPFTLTLSGAETGEIIRYTRDGSMPKFDSTPYQGPIFINRTTIIRARKFVNGLLPSKTQSHSYFINTDHDLPIISFVVDPADMFDEESGLYTYGDQYNFDFPHFGANFWQDEERPVNLSFYNSDGKFQHGQDAGFKIFGGYSRAFDQRSLSLFARKTYGSGKFDYPIFKNLDYDSFNSFVLRNSGNDWTNSCIRDGVMTTVMSGTDLEIQAFEPHVTYINGEYWGIYNVREKINEHFLSAKSGVPTDEIHLLELQGQVKHGSNEGYLQLYQYIEQNDLSIPANYQLLSEQIDMDNHILYTLAQVYYDNQDWPGNNIKYWKAKEGKWRWILFDTDFGLGMWNADNYRNNTVAFVLEDNGPGWPNPPWSTLMFRKLVQNETYLHKFVNRFADEMNSRFLPSNVNTIIDSLSSRIETEIPSHFERWGAFPVNWPTYLNNLKTFTNNRQREVKRHILTEFNLPAYHQLTVINNQTDKGYVIINENLRIGQERWNGDYFEEVPFTIRAVPRPGYEFSHWVRGGNSPDSSIVLDIIAPHTIEPSFTGDGTSASNIGVSPKVNIYPNPISNVLNIEVSGITGFIDLKLMDNSGKELVVILDSKVVSKSVSLQQDISDFPVGIYFVELSGEQIETRSYKVVKQ